ncbi:MAG: hypothetical protein LJE67_09900 [Salaquimonas sp.]|jgi:hypothetical protein|nr:hypothetical protein [Salaquimonas sp.]
MTAINDDEEKPLAPEVERLRRKMVRLLVISIGIMMVGLMAVLGAIVYKISARSEAAREKSAIGANSPGVPVEPGFAGRIDLPEGSTIVSTSLDGGNILLHVRIPGQGEKLLVYSLGEDRVIATVTVD